MYPCDSARNKDISCPGQQQETARLPVFPVSPQSVQATVGTNEARCENCCWLELIATELRLSSVSAPDTGSCRHQRGAAADTQSALLRPPVNTQQQLRPAVNMVSTYQQ